MMRPNTLFALIVVTLLVAAGTIWSRYDKAGAAGPPERGQPVIKGLVDVLNDVRTIDVLAGDEHFQLKGSGRSWSLPAKANYPANPETVSKLLFSLERMQVVEVMTSDPTKYDRLGVGEPGADGGGARRVRLLDENDAVLAAVIIGNPRTGSGQEVYVRKPDDGPSYVASERVDVPVEPIGWIDKVLMRFDVERVQRVVLTHADGEQVIARKEDQADPDFELARVPEGRAPKSPSEGRRLAGLLSYVTFDDVVDLAGIELERDDAVKAAFQTFDGLMITVTTVPIDDDPDGRFHARLRATTVGDDVQPSVTQEATALDEHVMRFAFVLPDYKGNEFRRRLDDVLVEVVPEEQPGPPEVEPAPSAPESVPETEPGAEGADVPDAEGLPEGGGGDG